MMYYIIQRRATHIIRNILKTVGVVFLVLVVINLFSSDLVGSLIARLGESTRSSQLETFFEQIPLSSLISGLGYNAIDEKTFLFLRTHKVVLDSLMDITKGDYARFNSNTYLEVYEDIQEKAQKKYKDEVVAHTKTQEKLKKLEKDT